MFLGFDEKLEWLMNDDSGDCEGDEGEEHKITVAQDWRSETGSLFQRWGDAYRNERLLILEAGWKAARATAEVRLQRGGCSDIELHKLENLVRRRESSLQSIRSLILIR